MKLLLCVGHMSVAGPDFCSVALPHVPAGMLAAILLNSTETPRFAATSMSAMRQLRLLQ